MFSKGVGMGIVILLAAQALSAADLRPSGFYVAGVTQGMTLADYNALIANGGYKSQPLKPDTYQATINGRVVYVSFCQGRVARAISEYSSTDWMRSMKALEVVGFKWLAPVVQIDEPTGVLQLSSLAFGVTRPKGFNYFVAPMVKGATANGRDVPPFQLMFEAMNHACQ